jgi:hypothetical protein
MAEQYPTPWCVGPFGCIWVAADVEFKDEKWRETCSNPRLVVDTGPSSQLVAGQIVEAVNTAAISGLLVKALEEIAELYQGVPATRTVQIARAALAAVGSLPKGSGQ